MTIGDSALLAGLFGAIMGLIKVIEMQVQKSGSVKASKSSSVPPDVCVQCREKVSDIKHDVAEAREDLGAVKAAQAAQVVPLARIANGVDELVQLARQSAGTGRFPTAGRAL